MISITKQNFFNMTEKAISASRPELKPNELPELASDVFTRLAIVNGSRTDRFILQGYTCLIECDLKTDQLPDPKRDCDVTFLMPKTGLLLYLESVCREFGADPVRARATANALTSRLNEEILGFGRR